MTTASGGPPQDLTSTIRTDVVEKGDAGPVQLPNPVENRSAELRRAAALATTRVRERYPFVPPALIDRCITGAVDHYHEARVRKFLPVLLERWAADAVEAASGPELQPHSEITSA